MHCVSGYPTPPPEMMQRFGLVTGLSDHTLDSTTAITGVAAGASIIEKHCKLNKKSPGPDDSVSLEPAEMTALCKSTKTALGRVDKGASPARSGECEAPALVGFCKGFEGGDVMSADAMRNVRLGFGLAPKYLKNIIGKQVVINIYLKTSTHT